MSLKSLIAEATRYARFTMKTSGFLAPIMMAATDKGIIIFSPDKMSDTGDKDDFANKVRLVTGSYAASAVVLIVESWITKAKVGEKLDTETPPSESYDREEVVVLIGQSPQGNITHLLPIHRLGNGKFWNLGDAEDMPADSFSGRFCRLATTQARGRKDPPDGQGRYWRGWRMGDATGQYKEFAVGNPSHVGRWTKIRQTVQPKNFFRVPAWEMFFQRPSHTSCGSPDTGDASTGGAGTVMVCEVL